MPKQSGLATPAIWRRRPWTSLRSAPRSSRITKAFTVLMLLTSALHALNGFCTARREISIKYRPTQFTELSYDEHIRLADQRWQLTNREPHRERADKLAYSRHTLLNDILQWTRLGHGFEGETFRYHDVVVKVYRERHTPFRNCVPGYEPEQRWPTEIAASLILGGMGHGEMVQDDASFLPVTDYFLAPPSEQAQPGKWHFVTDFQVNGNLAKLSQRLHQSASVYTARDLDIIFRPSLARLLRALHDMHTKYNLCHDDLKMDNIFIGTKDNVTERLPPTEATHWLLADLGNVREREHPYHTTSLWTKANLVDCRANDVVRLVKTYMEFLRMSVDDIERFDAELFDAAEPWSHLFWSVWDESRRRDRTTANLVLKRSLEDLVPANPPSTGVARQPFDFHHPLARLFAGRRWALGAATKLILKTKTSEKRARFWGMVSVFGVPYPSCAGSTT